MKHPPHPLTPFFFFFFFLLCAPPPGGSADEPLAHLSAGLHSW